MRASIKAKKRRPVKEEMRNTLARNRARSAPRDSVTLGFTAHGNQINDTEFLDTLTFRLPSNVRVILFTIPGAALWAARNAFFVFHAMIKHLSQSCLKDMFADDASGVEVRRFMSEAFASQEGSANVSFNLYRGECPELILSTSQNPGARGPFSQYKKSHLDDHAKWIDRPSELEGTTLTPDDFPFLFLKRRSRDPPVPMSMLPVHHDASRYNRGGLSSDAMHQLSYANEAFAVDPGLMTSYFDRVFRLSTFIGSECTDRNKDYNVIVFSCRVPMYYDPSTRTFEQGDFMDIDSNVFVQRNRARNRAFTYVDRGRNRYNLGICDPRTPYN